MNKLKILFLLLFMPLLLFGQIDSVDVWISRIDNSSVDGRFNYLPALVPSHDVMKLIGEGKSIENKLVELLTDLDKGITAHYILSNIYGQLCSTVSIESGYVVYNYNGLEFTQTYGKWVTDKLKLKKIKEYWERELKRL